MIQIRPWKVALVALAFVFGLVFTVPNLLQASVTAKLPAALAQRLNLGLDLQGGTSFLVEMDTNALANAEDVGTNGVSHAPDVSGALSQAGLGTADVTALTNVLQTDLPAALSATSSGTTPPVSTIRASRPIHSISP